MTDPTHSHEATSNSDTSKRSITKCTLRVIGTPEIGKTLLRGKTVDFLTVSCTEALCEVEDHIDDIYDPTVTVHIYGKNVDQWKGYFQIGNCLHLSGYMIEEMLWEYDFPDRRLYLIQEPLIDLGSIPSDVEDIIIASLQESNQGEKA